jgi:hypothetical protein
MNLPTAFIEWTKGAIGSARLSSLFNRGSEEDVFPDLLQKHLM